MRAGAHTGDRGGPRTLLAALAIALALFGCTVAPPRPDALSRSEAAKRADVTSRTDVVPPTDLAPTTHLARLLAQVPRPEPERRLDPGQRVLAFDKVWKTIEARYYDPALKGIDWPAVAERYRPRAQAAIDDETFWRTLQRMAAELRDAHTRVHDPRQAAERRNEQAISVGVGVALLGEQVAINSVEPGSEAARQGVAPGDLVVAVDGVPVDRSWQRWREEMGETSTTRASRWGWLRGTISGVPGTLLALDLLRDGRTFRVSLPRRVVSTALRVEAKRLASGLGYVAFNRFRTPLAAELRAAIASLGAVPGLVIDLRSNGGGDIREVRAALAVLVPAPARFARSSTRGFEPGRMGRYGDWIHRALGQPPSWSGPIVVLVGPRTASGSELMATALRDHLGAKIVGTASCGCVQGIRRYEPLPGGAELAVSEVGFAGPRGERLEGVGLIPDVIAEPTLEDLRRATDRALAEAERLLAGAGGGARSAARPRSTETASVLEASP